MVWLACTRRLPRFRPESSIIACSALSARASTAVASASSSRPASVSSTRRPTRSNSGSEKCASRWAMAALAADCARLSDFAPLVTWLCCATATKIRNCSSVSRISPGQLDEKKAEHCNQDGGEHAQEERPGALGRELSYVRRKAHRGERQSEKKGRGRHDHVLCRR